MATIHHDSGTGTTPTTPKEIADWLKDEMGEELGGEPSGDAIWYSPADEGEPGSVKFLIWNSVYVLSPAEFEELKRLLPTTRWEEHAWDEELPVGHTATVESTAKNLVNQLLEDEATSRSLCEQYPHLADLMANVFGGYPDCATKEKEEPGECESILAFGQQEGANLAAAEEAAQKYAAKFKEWGGDLPGIPFEGDVPEYDQLLASDPGIQAIQAIVVASD